MPCGAQAEEVSMTRFTIFAGSMAVSIAMLARTSLGQERDAPSNEPSSARFPGHERAVELTLATGYTQSLGGDVTSGAVQPSELGSAGGELRASVGYRILPELAVAVYGSAAMFQRGQLSDRSMDLRAASAGVEVAWHLLPRGEQLDPWISLGTGWRGYWVSSDVGSGGVLGRSSTSLQGLQMGKLQIGVDYRIAPAIAISPVVGADLSAFMWETSADRAGVTSVAQTSTFVFVGLLGRFDLATAAKASPRVATR
jgi:hypothetical protein